MLRFGLFLSWLIVALASNVLFLVAHPDDEALFFSPTLLNMNESKAHILCLSNGNKDGLGKQRAKEMIHSCLHFGVREEECVILDIPDLPDDPHVWWDEKVVLRHTLPFVKQWNIESIITFDLYGISGHANHRAIASAVIRGVRKQVLPFPSFTLSSSPLLIKYLYLPFNRISTPIGDIVRKQYEEVRYHNSWNQYVDARAAFSAHASQQIWFRSLYQVFSKYMWQNQLKLIQVE